MSFHSNCWELTLISFHLASFLAFSVWWACVVQFPRTAMSQVVSSSWVAGPEIGGLNFPECWLISFDDRSKSDSGQRILGVLRFKDDCAVHVQAATSSDFVNWSLVLNADGSQLDALPDLPPWVNSYSPNTWAPDVVLLADGSYLMYFSATTAEDPHRHCIGAAFSDDILGPYTPQNDPLFCPLAQGGAIDAAAYSENGQNYVVYKIDGNSMGHGGACRNNVPPYVPTSLVLQAVNTDGVTLQGPAMLLLDNNGEQDQGVIEAPSLVKVGSAYVLFFSSGCFATGFYTVSYATSTSLTGPYTRASAPLFETDGNGLYAPGGASVASDAVHMVFHADFRHGRALYETVIEVSANYLFQDLRRSSET